MLEDGTVAVEARGKYVKMSLDEIAPEMARDAEWFPDTRGKPGEIEI